MTEKQADIALLQDGLTALALDLPKNFITKILQYVELLIKWNKVYNLTAITDVEQIIIKHIFDSLAINRHLQGKHFIDVGTGAGFPGIPLALANPDQSWYLLDSLEKRTRFLSQVKLQLKLDNVEIITARAEHYQVTEKFDGVVTRAFSSLPKMIQQCSHLSPRCYAMKGYLDSDENITLENYPHEIISLQVPFLLQFLLQYEFVQESLHLSLKPR